MKKRLTSVSAAVLSLVATSCYNNPQTSLKHPGEGPANVHARPAVGPGTVSGGSTAGPQPAAHTAHGQQQTQPQPSGATQHGAPEAGVH
ncbi:MAG TPA: hypothetical protein VES20_24200 [Bryobacteraceae bacterium]|nr:hypothetical protein [Bryobacteraceae bacterium]